MFALSPSFSTSQQPLTQIDRIDLAALLLVGLIKAQAANMFCQSAARKLKKAGTEATVKIDELFVERTHTDESQQKLVVQSLRKRISGLFHHFPTSEHSEQQSMAKNMR